MKNIGLLKKTGDLLGREQHYFNACEKMITDNNRFMVRSLSYLLFGFYLIMIVAAEIILPDFRVHPVYYLMIPILVIFIIYHFVTGAVRMSYLFERLSCLFFYMLLYLNIILIDIIPYKTKQAGWFPILLVVFPVVFIEPVIGYILEEGILLCVFIFLDNIWKDGDIASRDSFNAVASFGISILVAGVVTALRATEGLGRLELEEVMEKEALARREADEANMAKSDFLSQMSHEIRTPINAILGMDELILREYDDEVLREYALTIYSSGNTLLSLINDILDFSKIEAGKMELLPYKYNISALIIEMQTMIEPRAKKKGLEFDIRVNETMPYVLFGDELRVKQCVLNLLTNGVKYTDEGRVELLLDYGRIDEKHISLHVCVKDTGIGIREEDAKKLTEPFARIDESRNHKIEGTGLGMSIVTRLLYMMDSHLEIKSVYGRGSEFSFEIVQEVSSWKPLGDYKKTFAGTQKQKTAYHNSFSAPDASILIVDDNETNLMVACGLLKKTALNTDTALSGEEALKMCENKKYDIIFIDHKMPKMDGVEMLGLLKQNKSGINAKTPCIALTANVSMGAKESYQSMGFEDYLSKPIDSAALEKMCMDYLPKEKLLSPAPDETNAKDNEKKTGTQITALFDIAQISVPNGISACGSKETYWDTIRVFSSTAGKNADEIESYYNSEDWENYTIKVHALKSSAKSVGADSLSLLAKRLEEAGNKGDIVLIRERTPDLLSDYRSLNEKLSEVFKETSHNAVDDISQDMLDEALEQLKLYVNDMDYDMVVMVLDHLKDYRLPKEANELVKEADEAMLSVDWGRMDSILRKES